MAVRRRVVPGWGLQLEAINSGNAMSYREQLQVTAPREFKAIQCIRTKAFATVGGGKSCQKQFCMSLGGK